MEFHVWGRLDESGKIQSVQSSCSHGNAFNFLPNQMPAEASWIGGSGEKYVPYSTKKELVYKLDTKIDEMSLIMVQLGELTKRVKLQEKLLAEYETKSERHTEEIKRLTRENEQLRSLVYQRRRISSSSLGSSFESNTSPKVADVPLMSPGEDIVFPFKDVNTIDDVRRLSGCDISPRSRATKVEVSVQLEVDEHGYVPLWGESGVTNKHRHETGIMIDYKRYDNVRDELSTNFTDSGLDETDGFADVHSTSIESNVIEKTSCPCERGEAGQPEIGEFTSRDARVTYDGDAPCTPPPTSDTSIPSPDAHKPKPPRYSTIPDDLVSPMPSPPKSCSPPPGTVYYSMRPRMPLPDPTRPDSTSSHINSLTKELKNCSNGEKKDSEAIVRVKRLGQRRSSPQLTDLGADARLARLIENMKTTMEWNEARRLLMSKSTACTVEEAEESIRAIVKDTYYKCASKMTGSGKRTIECLAQKIRNHLRGKGTYDDDLLTKEFLEKCLHMLKAV